MTMKKPVYPSKTTLNLVIKEHSSNYVPKLIGLAVLMAILIGVFCKFAVIDRLDAAGSAKDQVVAAQEKYDRLAKANVNYEAVRVEYEKYFSGSNVTPTYIDCMDVMSLIESKLMPAAGVYSVNIHGNTLAVVLTNILLDGTADIYKSLTDSPIVASVNITTANATDINASSVTINVELKSEGGASK